MFCCCGQNSQSSGSISEGIPPPRDEPVLIEPLPDVADITVAPGPHALPPLLVEERTNWVAFEDSNMSSQKEKAVPPPLSLGSAASNEHVDMRGALDEHLTKRAYILGLSNEELHQLPVAYIESFYPNLSPGEIMELEQRLCDAKSSCLPKGVNPRERLAERTATFLRSLRLQFSLRNSDSGFWIEDEVGGQTGLDVRDLILVARDEEVADLDAATLARIRPFLSAAELEDIRERIELVHIARRAQLASPPSPSPPHEDIAESPSLTFCAPKVNADIYHLTAVPTISLDEPNDSEVSQHPYSPRPLTPIIQVNGVEEPAGDVELDVVEETVYKMVDDILRDI